MSRCVAVGLLAFVWSLVPTESVRAEDGRCESYLRWPRADAATASWKVLDLCQAYQFPTSAPGGGVIGILELGGGWVQSDLDKFSQLNGLPPITVIDVSVNGGQNRPGLSNADFEVALDIEVAAAAYFSATGEMPVIKVFFAPNSTASFVDIIEAAVDEGCDVLSISWGASEQNWSKSALQQVDAAAQMAAASGLTLFAASGDNSSSDGGFGKHVDAPASCPHIVGCGGTRKTMSSEVVWGDGKARHSGTGGGFSKVFPVQAFQIGAPSGPGRMVPDVAANADPNTGYRIVARGSEVVVGGTSAVSPLYSGLFAAIGPQLGFVTPTLWLNPTAFTDITSGSNGAFSALPGPDPCTGLGVPKGTAIAGLFGAPLQSLAVNDWRQGSLGGRLRLNGGTVAQFPSTGPVRWLTGSAGGLSSQLTGTFTAVVFDPQAIGLVLFQNASPAVFGAGGQMGAESIDVFTFSSRSEN